MAIDNLGQRSSFLKILGIGPSLSHGAQS